MSVTGDTVMALSDKGEVFAWGRGSKGMWQEPNAEEAFFPEAVRGLSNILDRNHPPLLANFIASPASTPRFTIVGARGFPYAIQTSSDFANWTTYTNLLNATGLESIELPTQQPNASAQFFRIYPNAP
jgi:hypothetical protein